MIRAREHSDTPTVYQYFAMTQNLPRIIETEMHHQIEGNTKKCIRRSAYNLSYWPRMSILTTALSATDLQTQFHLSFTAHRILFHSILFLIWWNWPQGRRQIFNLILMKCLAMHKSLFHFCCVRSVEYKFASIRNLFAFMLYFQTYMMIGSDLWNFINTVGCWIKRHFRNFQNTYVSRANMHCLFVFSSTKMDFQCKKN